jgi:hypothetical protein
MRLFNSAYIIMFLILFSTTAAASSTLYKHRTVYTNAATIGITHKLSGQDLSFIIDQKKLLKFVPKLQKAGFIDPVLTTTEVSFYQPLLAASVSIPYITQIIKNIYSTNPNIDQIHVYAYLFARDLYGNNEKSYCYSFDFDRTLYQKINWKAFRPVNIKQIAPNFKTSDICRNLVETNPTSY